LNGGNVLKYIPRQSEVFTISAIAMIYILLWILMPSPSFWGLDNGIKYQGARSFSETGSIRILYSGSDFDPKGIYRPILPPFGALNGDNQVPTFSVTFMLIAGIFYSLFGQSGPHLLSFIGGLACLVAGLLLWLNHQQNRDASVYLIILGLGSPLLFYSLTLWEHSWAMAFVMFSYLALFQPSTRRLRTNSAYFILFVAGVLIGLSVVMRTEAVMWIVLTITFWQHTGRGWKSLIPYSIGVLVIFLITISVNYIQTDKFLPLHLLSNIEFHSQSSLRQLILSRIYNLHIALFSGFTNHIYSLLGLIPLITILFWHKWRKYRVLWHLLMIAFFMVWCFYWMKVLNADNSPAYMGISGGLFWIVPLSALAVMKLKKEKHHFIKFIWLAVPLFIMLYAISSPKGSGIHWGPRLIITTIPFIMLLATVRLHHWWKGIRWARLYVALLLLLSIWGQIYSVQTLHKVRSENEALNRWIVSTGSEPIITTMWWLAGDCGLHSDRIPWYTVRPGYPLQPLLAEFRSDGLSRFNYVERPPYISANRWESMGAEYLSADYFFESDGRLRRSHIRIRR
jgi:hypothetical protein